MRLTRKRLDLLKFCGDRPETNIIIYHSQHVALALIAMKLVDRTGSLRELDQPINEKGQFYIRVSDLGLSTLAKLRGRA